MRVALLSAEAVPYSKTGGFGDLLSRVEQIEVVLERLGKTKANAEFLASMQT